MLSSKSKVDLPRAAALPPSSKEVRKRSSLASTLLSAKERLFFESEGIQ